MKKIGIILALVLFPTFGFGFSSGIYCSPDSPVIYVDRAEIECDWSNESCCWALVRQGAGDIDEVYRAECFFLGTDAECIERVAPDMIEWVTTFHPDRLPQAEADRDEAYWQYGIGIDPPDPDPDPDPDPSPDCSEYQDKLDSIQDILNQ